MRLRRPPSRLISIMCYFFLFLRELDCEELNSAEFSAPELVVRRQEPLQPTGIAGHSLLEAYPAKEA